MKIIAVVLCALLLGLPAAAEASDTLDVASPRPKVGVVLCGGGAKGAAHIGVLKVLEEYGIKPDIVVGTSMGAIIGGFYSLGYNADEIETIISAQDWTALMRDAVPRRDMTFGKRFYVDAYPLRIPFTIGGSRDTVPSIIPSFLDNFPTALVKGQNVYNLFTSYAVGYLDSLDFDDLPIPFACVATDVLTKKEVVFRSGRFVDAVRSSMSIPGYFTPVRIGDMVLVDGGLLNNLPIDVAREMGADIVIGVQLGIEGEDGGPQADNIGDIAVGLLDMYMNIKALKNFEITDILIRPSVRGYGLLSFDTESIRNLISNGEEAARKVGPQLAALRSRLGDDSPAKVQPRKASRLDLDTVTLREVSVSGIAPAEEKILFRRPSIVKGTAVTGRDIRGEISRLYNTSAFESVTYSLEGDDNPYRMQIKFAPGHTSELGFGLRLDTEEIAAVDFEAGLNRYALYGSSLDFLAKLSYNPVLKLRYSYKFPSVLSLGAEYRFRSSLLRVDDYMKFLDHRFDLNAGMTIIDDMHLELGMEYDIFDPRMQDDMVYVQPYDSDPSRRNFVNCHLDADFNTLDDFWFPVSGCDASVSAFYNIYSGYGKMPFYGVAAHFRTALSLDKGAFTFIPEVYHRTVFGKDVPLAYMNIMGGFAAGRYMDQQIPFTGFVGVRPFGKSLTAASVDFRVRFLPRHYVDADVSWAVDGNSLDEVLALNGLWGVKAGYTYNSIIGPLSFNLFWSDCTGKAGLYASYRFAL